MTNHPNRSRAPADHIAARELALYATNDGMLYRTRAQPIMANLRRKMARGVYDPELTVKAWTYLAEEAARRYCAEFGGHWPDMFSPSTREFAAREIGEHYAEELAS